MARDILKMPWMLTGLMSKTLKFIPPFKSIPLIQFIRTKVQYLIKRLPSNYGYF